MSNPFDLFGVSDSDLARAIRESAAVDAGIDKFMKEEVIPYAKSISPVDSGSYAASWKIIKRARGGKGVVGPTDWKSHFVEFGTGPDPSGSHSKFGPNTPTPAHAIVQKVCERFGGNLTDNGMGMSLNGGE